MRRPNNQPIPPPVCEFFTETQLAEYITDIQKLDYLSVSEQVALTGMVRAGFSDDIQLKIAMDVSIERSMRLLALNEIGPPPGEEQSELKLEPSTVTAPKPRRRIARVALAIGDLSGHMNGRLFIPDYLQRRHR